MFLSVHDSPLSVKFMFDYCTNILIMFIHHLKLIILLFNNDAIEYSLTIYKQNNSNENNVQNSVSNVTIHCH